jgi:glycosyltransferase involved in cell wall biosynthesis
MRVALLTNILPPYRVPVFRALATTPGWQLRVLLNARSEFDRSWEVEVDPSGLDLEIVKGVSFVRGGRTLHVPLGLFGALRRFGPDVVVSGDLGLRTLLAALYCSLAQVPLVIWIYPTRVMAAATPRWRRALAGILLGRARAVIGMGRQARDVLSAWGVPAERLFDAPNAHNHEAYLKALATAEPAAREHSLRAALQWRARIALVVGRLVPSKGIIQLLDAWERLPPGLRGGWTLLVLGSGPLEDVVERARDAHPPGAITHIPAVQPREVIDFYRTADLLLFPSLADPWGLVVSEAMACGLPVLCSSRAGCAEDLVRPGENGWLVDPLDEDAFSSALREALANDRRQQLGESARETAERFTPEAMAEGMRRAVRHALSSTSS